MKPIKIAGVPEHFNLPWHLCLDNDEFKSENIDLQWIEVPEGTGKMCEMLRNKETDIAVILTEGIIKDIIAGNDCSIIQIYVKSPLIWGIHVAYDSDYETINDLKNTKAAISRLGSGSQLMAFVNAQNQGWNIDNLKFEIVNTIDGAVESLTDKKADYFMWEKFMTKPFVDAKIFRKIADCPSPWSCFVIAVNNEFLNDNFDLIEKLLKIINQKTATFKEIKDIDKIIAPKYNLKINDVQEWLKATEWSQENLNEVGFNKIQNQLLDLKIIDKKITFDKIIKVI